MKGLIQAMRQRSSRVRGLMREVWYGGSEVAPWYRRPGVWVVIAAIILPAGELLLIGWVAYVARRRATRPAESEVLRSTEVAA